MASIVSDVPDLLEIPDWLKRNPELARRGLVLEGPLKPVHTFFIHVVHFTHDASFLLVLCICY